MTAAASAQERHPNTELSIVDVTQLDQGEINYSYALGPIVELSDSVRAEPVDEFDSLRTSLSGATLVGTASIIADLLRPSDSPRSFKSGDAPDRAMHLQVSIEGEQYILDVVQSAYDEIRRLRHVTAVVVNHQPIGYARFTFDHVNNLLVGTISSAKGDYRILPISGSDTQLIVRLDARENNKYRKITVAGRTSKLIERITESHAQAELIADVQPWYISLPKDDNLVRIRGGTLGSVSLAKIADPDEVSRLLRGLAPITGFQEGLEFEITSYPEELDEADNEYAIRYRQLINGIPVRHDQEIAIDSTGKVLFILSSIVDPADAPAIESLIDERKAFGIAVDALKSSLGSTRYTFEEFYFPEIPKLSYVVRGDADGVWPLWHFGVLIRDGDRNAIQSVVVDALTGEVSFPSMLVGVDGEDFRHNVYKSICPQNPPEQAGSCTMLIWRESNDSDFECESDPDCSNVAYSKVKGVVSIANILGEQNADDNTCCFEIGRHLPGKSYDQLDVIVDTPIPGLLYGGFKQTTETILFPNETFSRTTDVILHELGHAYQWGYNRATLAPQNPPPSTTIYAEGAADAYAGALADLIPASYEPGVTWVIGDSPPSVPENIRRDLTINRMWADLDNPNKSQFEKQSVYGNFFYRLRQQNISKNRVLELTMQTQRLIRDQGTVGIDATDFWNALQASIKPGESTLSAAISTVFGAMSGQSPPPPNNPPLPPVIVDGTFHSCIAPYTVYNMWWSSSLGATDYETYYLNTAGVWTFDNSWIVTNLFAYVPYNTSWRVKACNIFGCSALSTDTFVTPDIC
jgi:hypothetical protein